MSNPLRLAFLLLALATLFLAAACDSSEEPDGRYSSLLRLVPDQPSFREGVTIVDYNAIRALPGYEPPELSGDSPESPATALRALDAALHRHEIAIPFREVLGAPWDSLPPHLANWQQGFGFELAAVDLALTAGTLPPRYLYAIGGDFDPAAIRAQLDACTDCLKGEERDHRGRDYTTWGEGQVLPQRLQPPAFDDLGRGGSFVFESTFILRSNFLDDFEASIDASQGRSSLLGDEDFGLLAGELDSLDLLALFVSDRTPGPDYAFQLLEDVGGDPAFKERMIAAWDVPAAEKLARYRALGVGTGVAHGEPFTLILLVHDSDEAATENIARLEARIETGLTVTEGKTWANSIDAAEIATQGRLLVATLRGGSYYWGLVSNPGLGAIAVEALLAHE